MIAAAYTRDRTRSIPDESFVRSNADRPFVNVNRLSNRPLPRKVSMGEKMRVDAKKQHQPQTKAHGKGRMKKRLVRKPMSLMGRQKSST